MAALATVGEWFGQGIIQMLIDKVSDMGIQKFPGHSDLQGNLKGLKLSLVGIRTLLKTADEKKNENDGLAGLMVELRDATYDAGDLLDEIDYQALKKKIENNNNREARNFLSSALISTKDYLAEIKYISEAVGRVREIQERLDSVASGMKEIIELLSYPSKKIKVSASALDDGWSQPKTTPGNRDTSSVLEVPETEVFGRDEEREDMIKYLLNSADESGSTNNNISVLAVIGIGGVGKTTLAQLVYNDQKATDYFELKMWVCVSEDFDVLRLTTMMIQSATKQGRANLTSLDAIQSNLREIVESTRFLLVLDDIWNLNSDQWERLCAPLLTSKQGSKILVTTRFKNVAEATEITGTTKTIFLNGLQDEYYWKLFNKYAFGSHKSEEHPHLEAIGKKIAEELRGSPLAARVMGSLLRKKLGVTYWRSILNKKPWTKEEGIMGVLHLSYEYLPESLKQCFAYSAVFPKDYHFKEDELVYLWMAQGFIAPKSDMRMEDTGKENFHVLISSSFFQPIGQPCYGLYIMHDLIHDLAQIVFEGEFVRVESDKLHGNSSIARHLSVLNQCTGRTDLSELCNAYKLRSLFARHRHYIFDMISFDRLSSIRMLSLQDCELEQLPENIGDLILLRHLDISFNKCLEKLPESICRLYNLQVLNLSRCLSFMSFPQGMSNLIKLRLLDTAEHSMSTVTNIGKLTSLQSLPAALGVRREKGHRITELKDMTQLHGQLHIKALENVDSKEEASEAKLDNKEHLEGLRLEWSVCNNTSDESYHLLNLEVLEGLRPHENLQSLTIKRYGGVRSPDWLDKLLLLNLTTITLVDCLWWEEIQSLAECDKFLPSWQKVHINYCPKLVTFPSLPPSLKYLHLSSLGLRVLIFSAVNQIDGEFLFFLLEDIYVSDMPNWEEWSVESGRSEAFPCLRHLVLWDCPKLKWLPALSRKLQTLHLKRVGVTTLPGLWEGNVGSALEKMKIFDCVELVSFPMETFIDFIHLSELRILNCRKLCMPVKPDDEDNSIVLPQLRILELRDCGQICKAILECLHNLTSLVELSIQECHDIKSLSRRKLIHLTRLQEVKIEDCKELKSIDGLQGLKSVKRMQILECPKLVDVSNIVHSETEVEEEQQQQQAEMGIQFVLNDIAQLKLSAIRGMLSSLKILHIKSSLRIMIFDGEEEFLQSLNSLQKLEFSNCNNLQNIDLHALPSLLILRVTDCPNIEFIQDKGLPATLRELELKRCQKFQSLSAELHTIPLQILRITKCPNMESVPEEGLPATLRELVMEGCWKLQSLPAELHTIPLVKLEICNCPNVELLPEKGLPATLTRLMLDNCQKFQSLPAELHTIPLESLTIDGCPNMESLPEKGLPATLRELVLRECNKLQSLPAELHTIALQHLEIFNCQEIQMLPEKGLPKSIKSLDISFCHPNLDEQVRSHRRKMSLS